MVSDIVALLKRQHAELIDTSDSDTSDSDRDGYLWESRNEIQSVLFCTKGWVDIDYRCNESDLDIGCDLNKFHARNSVADG